MKIPMHRPLAFALVIAVGLALLSACGPSTSAAARHAQALVARGDFRAAEKLADEELAVNPKDAGLWHVKIRSALAQGDNDRATRVYGDWTKVHGSEDLLALRMMAKTVLWQGLRVPSTNIRALAIRTIERLEIEDLSQDVGDLIASDDDLVAAAASAALLTSHPQAPEVATDLLRSDNPRARALVIEAIGRKVGKHARDELLKALTDPTPEVRRVALAAIAKLGNDDDTRKITELATKDADGQVRAFALRELAARSFGPAPDLVRAALADDYQGARLAALELVSKRDDEESIAILNAAATGEDLPVAFRAAAALYRAGKPAPIVAIELGLQADSWTVRASALNAIADASPKQTALRVAGEAITDDNVQVRLAAARVLRRLGEIERARQEFVAALSAEKESARLSAAIDLIRLKDDRGLPAIITLAGSSDARTRAGALRAHAFAKTISRALIDGLADQRGENRLIAADVILQLAL